MSFAAPKELRWLYVDFNSYFTSVEQQLQPRLRGKPVIVIPAETESTCAIAASYEARAFGIKTGTPVYEARKKCKELICVLARHDHYVSFHHRILEEIDRHIPVTAVCSIDEVACRLMDNETAPARAMEISRAIKAGLAKNIGEYLRCSIGIAPNRYLSKIATDMRKPDGLTVLPPEDLPHRLEALKLRDLPGIGVNMEARLNRAGIWDMKALLNLQPRHLRAVWGSIQGEKMWYLLRGYDLPEQETRRSTVGHSQVLAPELRSPAAACQVARRLVMKAAARLRRMEYYAAAFSVSFCCVDDARFGLEARCAPAQDSFSFLRMLESLWQEMAHESGDRRIKKVSVVLHHLTPVQGRQAQGDLFATVASAGKDRHERCEKISRAMDVLNQKFGRDTVLLGMAPAQGQSFSGTKIAFTRIPDREEFLE